MTDAVPGTPTPGPTSAQDLDQPAPTRAGWSALVALLRRDWLGLLAALALAVAAAAGGPDPRPDGLRIVDVVAAAIAIALVLARRRFPREAWAAGLVASVVLTAAAAAPTAILPAAVLLLLNLTLRTDRRTAMVAGAITVAVFSLIVTLAGERLFSNALLAATGWPVVAVAVGEALRTNRAYLAEVEERARRAEETREEEARRRVAEERLRIARDLHDLVAHHIAVVNVQAGLAGHLLRSQPDGAEEALRTVRASAATVLDELGALLGVLRQGDEGGSPTAPTPGLDGIAGLVTSFKAAGLDVAWETSGTPRPLASSVELAAYRVVQEGLTNAHKHGAGTARVAVIHGAEGLEVVVENPIGGGPVSDTAAGGRPGDVTPGRAGSGGFGLIGMHERVTAAGGTLEAGPAPGDPGLFRVRARFGPVAAR